MADHTNAEFVFTDFQNEVGWSDGMAWILGLLQSALSLIGYDAVFHMVEEMPVLMVEETLVHMVVLVVQLHMEV